MKLPVNEAELTGLRCRTQTLMGLWGRGGGGRRCPKKIFSSLRASVWPKNKVEGEGGSPGSATGFVSSQLGTMLLFNKF